MDQGLIPFYRIIADYLKISFIPLAMIFSTIFLLVLFLIGALGTYAERKISADIQKRLGPNRIGPFGLFQFLADALKMILKQNLMPKGVNSFLFFIAPFFAFLTISLSVLVLPFSKNIFLIDFSMSAYFLVAISSLMGIGIFLGGYASGSTWGLLGGVRGACQMISYEVPLVISLFSVTILSGETSLQGINQAQSGMPFYWFIFHNPFSFISFFIFFICIMAETNRAPFDLPESESELVSGFHTEYSGMKYAFFAISEFSQVFVVSLVASIIYLGGYNLPLNFFDGFLKNILELITLFLKTGFLYFFVIVFRWTLPRLKADQLITLSWKYLTPISLFCLVGSTCWMVFFNGKSLWEVCLSF